jgi:biotin operon repressor
MTQQELARGSRQRVNKTVKEFENEGIFILTGQKYLIKNMLALKAKTMLKNE